MAYVNFKEEKYKCLIQLEKRRANNKTLDEQLINSFSINTIIPYKKYSFRKIKDRTIFFAKNLNEEEFTLLENKYIVCSEFINCNICDTTFELTSMKSVIIIN